MSSFARARIERLRQRFAVQTHAGATIVEPGAVAPSGATHYRVFTPYWRAWRSVPIPPPIEPPRPVMLPPEVEPGRLPHPDELAGARAPALAVGGARAGAAQMRRVDATRYEHLRNDLAADGTSRLSPYLHLGCISPAEAARWAAAAGAEELLRQLCWRDFFAQLLAATPSLPSVDLRPARTAWVNDPGAVTAWKHGRTGYPLVDAAMRQLLDEGWIHNRARMIAASFLVRQLQVDWRIGAAHFMAHLIDGDLASNSGNWQWVAGTGHGSRPDRYFNPTLQGRRHDPAGTYIRRFVPELASLPASSIHDPSPADRRAAGYPDPIVPPGEVADRLRARP